jgi:hypothetical protein
MNKIMVEIKLLASLKGLTLTYAAQELGKRLGKPYSLPSLSKKLKRGTISYEEVRIIFDILGYDIKLIDKVTRKQIENLF